MRTLLWLFRFVAIILQYGTVRHKARFFLAQERLVYKQQNQEKTNVVLSKYSNNVCRFSDALELLDLQDYKLKNSLHITSLYFCIFYCYCKRHSLFASCIFGGA